MKPHTRAIRHRNMEQSTVTALLAALKAGLPARMEAALDDGDEDEMRDCIGLMRDISEAIAQKVGMSPGAQRPATDEDILQVLKRNRGNVTASAKSLGVSYACLFNRLKRMK